MSVSFNLNGEFIEFTTKKHNRMDGKYDLPNFIYCNLQNLQTGHQKRVTHKLQRTIMPIRLDKICPVCSIKKI
jgi:hypothetical protein